MKLLYFSPGAIAFILLIGTVLNVNAQGNSDRPLPQFLFPVFADGVIVMKDASKSEARLNYNMVEEAMISEKDGVYWRSQNPALIDTIYLQNRKFVPVDNAFYEILATGEATFFLENKSKYVSVGEDIGYGVKSHSIDHTELTRFETWSSVVTVELPKNVTISKVSVNWVRRNGSMQRFNSEKQLLKMFPEKKIQISDYIDKQKINLKVREDLIKLGNFCNERIK
jgi:hypothetical protein